MVFKGWFPYDRCDSWKNSSAIVAIYGFHVIAAIAKKMNEDRGDLRLTHRSRHLSNSTWRLWIVDSCLKVGFLYLWVLFNVSNDGKEKEPIDFGFERSSRRGNFGILLSGTQYILVLLLSLRSLESGFHMIAPIAEIELKTISAIVVAAIVGEWFPYDRYDRWTFVSAIVAIIWKLDCRVLFCVDLVTRTSTVKDGPQTFLVQAGSGFASTWCAWFSWW